MIGPWITRVRHGRTMHLRETETNDMRVLVHDSLSAGFVWLAWRPGYHTDPDFRGTCPTLDEAKVAADFALAAIDHPLEVA